LDQQLTKTKLTDDAIYFANLTVDELAGELQRRVDDYYQYVRINGMSDPKRIADNNNVILLQDLSLMHGVHFAPTSKDALIAMVNEVRVFVGQGRLRVHPQCKEVIGCLSTAIWNKQRTQFDVSDLFGHFDALAAIVYMIRNLDQYTNPIPITSTAMQSTHHINYQKVEQQSNLKKMFKR